MDIATTAAVAGVAVAATSSIIIAVGRIVRLEVRNEVQAAALKARSEIDAILQEHCKSCPARTAFLNKQK